MKASETSLRNLLEGTKQFQIPLFQRPYSWNKDNWKALWEDLLNLYNGEVEGSYFLGPIVTQSLGGTADGISPFIVIDGQQRLTTLSIILAALRHHLIKNNDREMAEELYELFLINKFQKDEDRYKVLPTQNDREVYKSIIKANEDNEVKKEGSIYEAYKFFYDGMKKHKKEKGSALDCNKFKTVILERIVLVNITSDDRDNPYLIFESLNYKGQDLTQADLVRNYIFMKLPSELREDVYKKEWLPVQEQFKQMAQKDYSEELTNAFWFYLRKDGESVNQKEVYKSLKKRFDDKTTDTKLAKIVLYYQRKTSEVSMGGHRLKVIPHLDYTELTERYKACKEPKERSRWLAIRLLSRPNRSMSIEEVANIVGFSPDWIRKIVRRYNQHGPDSLLDGHQKNPGGKKSALTEEQQKQLFERLLSSPDDGGLWSGPCIGRTN